MKTINLNGTWSVRPEALNCIGASGLARIMRARDGWIEARVPGDVHLDLMRAGQMEEPLFGLNVFQCQWPETRSWWHRRSFAVSEAFLKEEQQLLIFEGLDYFAQVFVNGALVGEARNALVPAVFDVKGLLRAGLNDVVVRVTVGTECIQGRTSASQLKRRPSLYRSRHRMEAVRGQIRKPPFCWGWDWVERLPSVGIWRPARLEGRSGVILHEVRFDTVIQEGKTFVNVELIPENLHPWSERRACFSITLRSPRGRLITHELVQDLQVGRTPIRACIPIPQAELWWPNGMGGQPLYDVTVSARVGNRTCDARRFKYGLRTVTVDQSPLKEGRRFGLRVNGEAVFCKGGNWVPADALPARMSAGRYRRLVREAKEARFTMLRVWGGGNYEDDAFYEACDEAGILIFQDFMFACTDYAGTDPHFQTVVRAEAETAVRRLRHHACLALWCGNNENISWLPGRGSLLSLPIYTQILPDVCRREDPARFYWPSSPLGGEHPKSHLAGDTHPWPYAMGPNHNMTADATDPWRTRFVTEFGVIGPPDMETIRQYLKPEDVRPSSLAWRVHTNEFERGFVREAVRYHYGDPARMKVEEFMRYGALAQAFICRHQYEAQRFRRFDPDDDCQGFLIWAFNECWGEIGWGLVDYRLRRKAAWYAARSACRPVKVLCRPRGASMVTRVVNDTRLACEADVVCGWWRLDGGDRDVRRRRLRLAPNSMTEIRRERIPLSGREQNRWIYAARLGGPGLEADQSVWLFKPWREMEAPEPRVRISRRADTLSFESPAFCHMVHAEGGGGRSWSENYFDLIPGERLTVRRLAAGRSRPACIAVGPSCLVRVDGT